MNAQFDFGMIGLGVMGSNLLLNMADHNLAVIGFDLDPERCHSLENAAGAGTKVKGVNSLSGLVQALKKPRKIMMLVPAGKPVDDVIESLLFCLEEGDILIDGGNTFYKDTLRRAEYLKDKGIHFMGMGISGGEAGARSGPSMMPGGNKEAYEYLQPVLEPIAAKVDGIACVAFMGDGAAGHYVKMVHNGIEYALMQMISEVYGFLKYGAGYSNEELKQIFEQWNNGTLQSYLISITSSVFKNKDEKTGNFLVDVILDQAGSKGTGKWTSQEALNLPVAIPSIDAAVAARTLSGYKTERTQASEIYRHSNNKVQADLQALENALAFCFVVAYAQGLSMLAKASVELQMNIPLASVIRVWKAGCIIRSALLGTFANAFEKDPLLANILLNDEVATFLKTREESLRSFITQAVASKIPVPGIMSALAYFDGYCTRRMATSLIQAQRDFFGAHTYQRIDEPGVFHTEWHG
jgi:6-phosphogluconate dehydrogenase